MRDRFATHDSPPRRFRVSPRSSAKLRRKEKDSRNSSLSRRTFLGRVVKRRGVWMLPHRSDTSRGHLHPPTRPRLTPPPSLPPSRRLSFSAGTPSRPRSRAIGGGLLPCGRLCRHFPGGACAGPSLPATTPALQLPGPARDSLSLSLSLSSRRASLDGCNGHCLRVKSFQPQAERHSPSPLAGRNGRLDDFRDFRSYDRRLPTTAVALARNRRVRLGRAGATIDGDLLSRLRSRSSLSKSSRLFEQGISGRFTRYWKVARSSHRLYRAIFRHRCIQSRHDASSLIITS